MPPIRWNQICSGTRCRVGACSSVRGHRRGAIAPCSQNSTLPREFTKFYAAANTAMSAALMGISLRLGLIHPTGRLSAWSTVVSGGARRQKLGAGGAPLAPLRRGLCLFRVKAGKSQSKQMTSGMHPESGRSICALMSARFSVPRFRSSQMRAPQNDDANFGNRRTLVVQLQNHLDDDLRADLDHAVGRNPEVVRCIVCRARQQDKQVILPYWHIRVRRRSQRTARQEE